MNPRFRLRAHVPGLALALALCPLHGAPPYPTEITVNITPPGAVAAGAAWRLAGEELWRPAGVAQTNVSPGMLLLEFRAIPGWETPSERTVNLSSESMVSLFVEYVAQPQYPIELSTTFGGYLHTEAWSPTGFSTLDGRLDRAPSLAWESAVRFPRTARMPTNNLGWRVRVYALAQPHYQFVGWQGDLSGARNPITLVMNRPYRIRALFERALGLAPAMAVHSAGDYHASGSLVVHGQFIYEPADRLRELRWRPELPKGWSLAGVSGLGGPIIEDGEVRFTEWLGHNPIHFNMTLAVPANESGPRALAGEVEFSFVDGTNSFVRSVRALAFPGNELLVNSRPSPAAILDLSLVNARPVLQLRGEIGRTYTVQQVPEFLMNFERFWWFLADVTFTNSPQTWVDDSFSAGFPSSMYRAVLIE